VRPVAALLLILFTIAGAAATPPQAGDEAAIRAVIAAWYGELKKGFERKHWRLYAPMAIDGGPGETEINPGSRARSPTISNELAARALQFAYDIDVLKIDTHFAKAIVWERGYFYAWASHETYENAAHAVFVLEKQSDGRWLILAHEARSVGIPPNKRTMPLPDMKPLWEARGGAAAKSPAAE
jgi:hypothetical protein